MLNWYCQRGEIQRLFEIEFFVWANIVGEAMLESPHNFPFSPSYIYIYIYTHMCIYIYVYHYNIYIYIHIHLSLSLYIYIYIYVLDAALHHLRVRHGPAVGQQGPGEPARRGVLVHHIYTCVTTYTYTTCIVYIYIYIEIYIHTYTYTLHRYMYYNTCIIIHVL